MAIRIVTGFRDDQKHTIDDDEAHKAYYLFLNPDKRGVFNNGLALIGKNIQTIEPDYQSTMGWNPSHEVDDNDWNEIRRKGVDKKLQDILQKAKRVCSFVENNPKLLEQRLTEIDTPKLIADQ